jgi:flagellar basal body-associated protein FliL
MLLKIILISAILLAFVVLGLGVQLFFSKKKRFPQTQIGHNSEMKKRKIPCPQTQDKITQKNKKAWRSPI